MRRRLTFSTVVALILMATVAPIAALGGVFLVPFLLTVLGILGVFAVVLAFPIFLEIYLDPENREGAEDISSKAA